MDVVGPNKHQSGMRHNMGQSHCPSNIRLINCTGPRVQFRR